MGLHTTEKESYFIYYCQSFRPLSPLKLQGQADAAWKGRVQKVCKVCSLQNFFTRSCLEKKRRKIPLGVCGEERLWGG